MKDRDVNVVLSHAGVGRTRRSCRCCPTAHCSSAATTTWTFRHDQGGTRATFIRARGAVASRRRQHHGPHHRAGTDRRPLDGNGAALATRVDDVLARHMTEAERRRRPEPEGAGLDDTGRLVASLRRAGDVGLVGHTLGTGLPAGTVTKFASTPSSGSRAN